MEAALLPQSQLRLEGLVSDSIQGDAQLVELGRRLGIASQFDSQGVTLDTSGFIGCCCSSFADMTATPDLALSWAVLLCLLERSFRMTGVRTLHLKESDRVEALRAELLKLGYVLKIESDMASVCRWKMNHPSSMRMETIAWRSLLHQQP